IFVLSFVIRIVCDGSGPCPRDQFETSSHLPPAELVQLLSVARVSGAVAKLRMTSAMAEIPFTSDLVCDFITLLGSCASYSGVAAQREQRLRSSDVVGVLRLIGAFDATKGQDRKAVSRHRTPKLRRKPVLCVVNSRWRRVG